MLKVTLRGDDPDELRRELEEIADTAGRITHVPGSTIGAVIFDDEEET